MGLITEMFLTFDGFIKPDIGDHLRISCVYKGVVRDVCTVIILQVCDCADEPETVLLQVENELKVTSETAKRHLDDFNNPIAEAETFFRCNTLH